MSDNRTNLDRISLFANQNQDLWAKESKIIENQISIYFNDGLSLYDIYEYARDRRKTIALQLNPKISDEDITNFGAIRGSLENDWKKFRDANYGQDIYDSVEFAGARPNPAALEKMKNVILTQSSSLKIQKLTQEDVRVYAHFFTIPRDAQNAIYYKDQGEHGKNLHFEMIVVPDSNDISITVKYAPMSEAIYKLKLMELNAQLLELKKPECEGNDFLYKLGLLAYDLSRLIPLWRGSSAVNEWILRGIAKAKGFDADIIKGAIKVKGLSFDVCAEIQTNRNKYAEDFVEGIKEGFNINFKNPPPLPRRAKNRRL